MKNCSLRDGVTTIKRWRHDIHGDAVRDSTTASGRGRLKVDLEPSMWQWHQGETNPSLCSSIIVIMEYLVKVSKRRAFRSLNEDILKITILKTNTPYPSRKIRHCFGMDNLNINIEEYIRLEEEKDRKRGRVFNWKTTKYGRIWNDEDIHDLKSVEIEFPAIAFNDEVSSKTLSYEPTVSYLNDKIDFRVSFDDSDDEDYTVILKKLVFL
ncbi:hypothetical protein Tco_1524395 [Tanacetum coccineum]